MEDKGEKKDKPPILKYLRSLFVHAIEMIDNDQCSEADAMSMISRFNAESKGFYDKTSLLNYDEAMEKLGIRNRNKFKDICRLHCIEQVKLNNMSVGFKRTEIEDLAYQLGKENGTD
jgi:hypothetical protein